jgi:hypothetical protein
MFAILFQYVRYENAWQRNRHYCRLLMLHFMPNILFYVKMNDRVCKLIYLINTY